MNNVTIGSLVTLIAVLAAVTTLAALGTITGQQCLNVIYFLLGGGVATTAHAVGAQRRGRIQIPTGTPPAGTARQSSV